MLLNMLYDSDTATTYVAIKGRDSSSGEDRVTYVEVETLMNHARALGAEHIAKVVESAPVPKKPKVKVKKKAVPAKAMPLFEKSGGYEGMGFPQLRSEIARRINEDPDGGLASRVKALTSDPKKLGKAQIISLLLAEDEEGGTWG